jgi:hypothetical protein
VPDFSWCADKAVDNEDVELDFRGGDQSHLLEQEYSTCRVDQIFVFASREADYEVFKLSGRAKICRLQAISLLCETSAKLKPTTGLRAQRKSWPRHNAVNLRNVE